MPLKHEEKQQKGTIVKKLKQDENYVPHCVNIQSWDYGWYANRVGEKKYVNFSVQYTSF